MMINTTNKQIIVCQNIQWLRNKLSHKNLLWSQNERPLSNELSIRIEGNVKNNASFLILSDLTSNPHIGLCEIMCISEYIRRQNATAQIELFIPYMPYSRHDKIIPNRPIAISVIVDILKSLRLKKIYSLDVHNLFMLNTLLPNLVNISSAHYIYPHLQVLNIKRPIIIAPDKGREQYAQELAKLMCCKSITLPKTRKNNTISHTIYCKNLLTLSTHNVILVDDIIDTSKTIRSAINFINNFKPLSISIISSFCFYNSFHKSIQTDISNFITIFDSKKQMSQQIISNIIESITH